MSQTTLLRLNKLRKLVGVNKILASTLEHSETLKRIVEEACDLVEGSAAILFLRKHPKSDYMLVRATCGKAAESLSTVRIPGGNSIPDALRAIRLVCAPRPHLTTPLIVEEDLVGALTVFDPAEMESDTSEEFLALLGDQAAVAVHNAELHAAVARERQTLLALMEYIPEGIAVVDPGTATIRFTSKAGLEMVGGSYESIINASTRRDAGWSVRYPDGRLVRSKDLPPVRAGLRGVVTLDEELIVARGDGTQSLVLCNSGPVKDEHGNTIAGVVTFRDISARKALEDELERQKALLEAVFDNTQTCLAYLDRDYNFVRVNEAYAKADEKSVADFPGRNHFDLYPSDARDVFDWVKEKGKQFQAYAHPFEYANNPERGVSFWDWSLVPLNDDGGKPQAFVLSLTDVTEKMRVQNELQAARAEAERRAAEMEAVISNMADGVIVSDDGGNVLIRNAAARRLLPHHRSEMGLREQVEVARPRRLDGSRLPEPETAVVRALGGETVTDAELLIDGASGPDTVIRMSSAPIRNAAQDVIAVVSVMRDVTAEKEYQKRLSALYEREKRIAETLQRAFLPSQLPCVEGWEIAATYIPALDEAQLGGDIYDVFRLPDGRIGVDIADVSGKGLKAASYGAMVRYMLRAHAYTAESPAEVLCRLSTSIAGEMPADMFVTVFYGVLDPESGVLAYANAGHDQPLLLSGARKTSQRLDVTGRAIGPWTKQTYDTLQTTLTHSDSLLLYTDGVTDARGVRERLGPEGLDELAAEYADLSPQQMIDSIVQEVSSRSGEHFPDDIAIVVIKSPHQD